MVSCSQGLSLSCYIYQFILFVEINSAVETHVRGLEYSDIVMWKYEGVNGYT